MNTLIKFSCAAAVLALAGCNDGHWEDQSNGLDHHLLFLKPDGHAGVGGAYRISFQDGRIFLPHCGAEVLVTQGLNCAGKRANIEEIISAACDDGSCTTSNAMITGDNTSAAVDVVPARPGAVILHVTVKFGGDVVESDRLIFPALAVSNIAVLCNWGNGDLTNTGVCPGRYSIYTGATFGWSADPQAVDFDGGVAHLDPGGIAFSTEGTTLSDGGDSPGYADIPPSVNKRVLAAGSSTIHVSFGSFDRAIVVHSVEPAEVASLAIRRFEVSAESVDTELDALTAEAAPTTLWFSPNSSGNASEDPDELPTYDGGPSKTEDSFSRYRPFDGSGVHRGLVMTGVLPDGGVVLGGAALLTSSNTSVVEPLINYDVSLNPTVGPDEFAFAVHAAGDATLSATIGPAQLSAPLHVIPRP